MPGMLQKLRLVKRPFRFRPKQCDMCFFPGWSEQKSSLRCRVSMGRGGATFWDKGTEVPSLSWDKGTMGQAKIFSGWYSQNLGWDRTGQPKSAKDCTTKRDREEKNILKQEDNFLKQDRMF